MPVHKSEHPVRPSIDFSIIDLVLYLCRASISFVTILEGADQNCCEMHFTVSKFSL